MLGATFRARALLAALSLTLFVAPARAQEAAKPTTTEAPALSKEVKEEVLAELEKIVTKQAFVPGVDLVKWPEFVAKQREAIDKAEKDTEFTRAVNSALRDFGISHIRFINPRAAKTRRQTTTIGVGLNGRPEDGGVRVTYVFPKSPAGEAGVKEGDLITLVDGKAPESAAILTGEDGTEVILKVKGADGQEREHKLKRRPYSVSRPDTLRWIGDDAAVIKIHSFAKGYERNAIQQLLTDASKAKYLVLDLRSNGGGAVANLQHLLGLLLPPETEVGTFVNRRTAEMYAEKNGGKVENDPILLAKDASRRYRTRRQPIEPFKGKIAVLINRGSASASEICASALREHLSAPIVGTRSAGAVLASVFGRLPHGYEIQYPISDYVSKNGVRLEKNPILPDVEVTERAEGDKDPAVEKALERLRSK